MLFWSFRHQLSSDSTVVSHHFLQIPRVFRGNAGSWYICYMCKAVCFPLLVLHIHAVLHWGGTVSQKAVQEDCSLPQQAARPSLLFIVICRPVTWKNIWYAQWKTDFSISLWFSKPQIFLNLCTLSINSAIERAHFTHFYIFDIHWGISLAKYPAT